MQSLNELQREGDRIVRELSLALERALMEFRNPASAAKPFEQRYKALERSFETFVKTAPHAADYRDGFLKLLRNQMEELKRRADNVHRRRGEVDGRMQTKYNEALGKALGKAPGQARDAIHGQMEGLVRKLIDQALPSGSQVPGHVKQTMGRELTRWIEGQEVVEDAYFVVESTVSEVAGYLHQRLTIKGEIEMTRTTLTKDPEVTKAQADAAEQRVGELAKRARDMDAEIARRIERNTLKVKGYFRLQPRIVLDPAKRFIRDVEMKAGINISRNDVKVELGTRLKVLNPLMNDRSYQAEGFVKGQINNNLNFGVSGSAGFNGQGVQDYQIKAQLTWRF